MTPIKSYTPVKRGYSRNTLSNSIIYMQESSSPIRRVKSSMQYGLKVYSIFAVLTFVGMLLLY